MNKKVFSIVYLGLFLSVFNFQVMAATEAGIGAIAVETQIVDKGDFEVNELIYESDIIKTGKEGTTTILFNDESMLTLGAESHAKLEVYALNKEGTSGKTLIRVYKGTFRFIPGEILEQGGGQFVIVGDHYVGAGSGKQGWKPKGIHYKSDADEQITAENTQQPTVLTSNQDMSSSIQVASVDGNTMTDTAVSSVDENLENNLKFQEVNVSSGLVVNGGNTASKRKAPSTNKVEKTVAYAGIVISENDFSLFELGENDAVVGYKTTGGEVHKTALTNLSPAVFEKGRRGVSLFNFNRFRLQNFNQGEFRFSEFERLQNSDIQRPGDGEGPGAFRRRGR